MLVIVMMVVLLVTGMRLLTCRCGKMTLPWMSAWHETQLVKSLAPCHANILPSTSLPCPGASIFTFAAHFHCVS
jgi:hypothetical protein